MAQLPEVTKLYYVLGFVGVLLNFHFHIAGEMLA